MRKVLLGILLLSIPSVAWSWDQPWIDSNWRFTFYQGTGSQTTHVATLEKEPGDENLSGDCRKEDGSVVEWVEFGYVTVPPLPYGTTKVNINTLTGGPVPREAVCTLYADGVFVEDWVVRVVP